MSPETTNPLTTSLHELYDDLRTPRRRIALGNHLRAVRMLGSAPDRRYAEDLLVRNLVRPKNRNREEAAQWLKNEKYDGLSPLGATELFAVEVHEAAIRHRAKYTSSGEEAARGLFNRDLAMNSIDTINDLWHSRQIADMSGLDYAEYADKFVGQYVARDTWRRPPSPRDLRSNGAYGFAWTEEARAERRSKKRDGLQDA